VSEGWKTLSALVCAGVAVVLTALLWQQPLVTTGLLVVVAAGMFAVEGIHPAWKVYLAGFCIGPLSEMLCIYTGAWAYAQTPVYSVVPLWLPFLWGVASLLLYRLSMWFGA
jgi:hypothetical protein